MATSIEVTIPTFWQHVRELRGAVDLALQEYAEELRSSAVMAASELIENAIKYGESVPECPSARFSLSVMNSTLTLEVSNGCTSPKTIADVSAHIDRINQAPDKFSLFLERLQEMLENPTVTGKLGLYRIAFEGQFAMSCKYQSNVVTLRAWRGV